MDVKRDPPKKTRRNILIGVGVVALVGVTFALNNLEARPPSVVRGELIIDSVRKGELIRNVRAPGTLESENMRYVAAVTAGRVETRPLTAGSVVTKNTVLYEMSNPDVQLQALDAERQVAGAEQDLSALQTNLETSKLGEESAIATLRSQYNQALRDAELNDSLAPKGLASVNDAKRARESVVELDARLKIEQQRLALMTTAMVEQIEKAKANVERLKEVSVFQKERLASLKVTAGLDGVLQALDFELGQWANSGQEMARVAQPGRFKAVLKVPDAQAKDIVVGQKVDIDTRPEIIKGHVMRVDPISTAGAVTVEVSLEGNMPAAARGDLAVDGTIEIERLENVMYVGRPAYGQPESTVGIFRIDADGKTAVRTNVKLGRASVNYIEVISGLKTGDRVIISDMSNQDNVNKVRIS